MPKLGALVSDEDPYELSYGSGIQKFSIRIRTQGKQI